MTAETGKQARTKAQDEQDEKSKSRLETVVQAEAPAEVEEPRALRYTTTGAQLRRFCRPAPSR